MKKYEVMEVDYYDEKIGLKVGDIVELKEMQIDLALVKLPKHLHGKGHNAYKYKKDNYRLLDLSQLKEIE